MIDVMVIIISILWIIKRPLTLLYLLRWNCRSRHRLLLPGVDPVIWWSVERGGIGTNAIEGDTGADHDSAILPIAIPQIKIHAFKINIATGKLIWGHSFHHITWIKPKTSSSTFSSISSPTATSISACTSLSTFPSTFPSIFSHLHNHTSSVFRRYPQSPGSLQKSL